MWICPDCRSTYETPARTCERDGAVLSEVLAHQEKFRYPLLGRVVGVRYHLIGGLGQGGLGTVYLARHLHLDQLFAVKFLETGHLVDPTEDEEEDARYRRDFLREARVASLIRHDAVVRVSDFGEHERLPFLVMEYVPGPSLLHVLDRRGRFAATEAIAISRRIAEALDAFHERRLVHRDLKPANVILDPRGDGRLTLVDLGLVKDLSGSAAKSSTHPLALRGTPGYLAPEQVPGWVLQGAGIQTNKNKSPVEARIDLYALGVIFYEMLAGVSPFPDGTNTQVIVYACTHDPTPLSSVVPPVKLLPGLETLVMRTMARNPDERPRSAAEFLEQLDEVAMGHSLRGSWPSLVVPGGEVIVPDTSPSPSSGVVSVRHGMPRPPAPAEKKSSPFMMTTASHDSMREDLPDESEWETVVYKSVALEPSLERLVAQREQTSGNRYGSGTDADSGSVPISDDTVQGVAAFDERMLNDGVDELDDDLDETVVGTGTPAFEVDEPALPVSSGLGPPSIDEHSSQGGSWKRVPIVVWISAAVMALLGSALAVWFAWGESEAPPEPERIRLESAVSTPAPTVAVPTPPAPVEPAPLPDPNPSTPPESPPRDVTAAPTGVPKTSKVDPPSEIAAPRRSPPRPSPSGRARPRRTPTRTGSSGQPASPVAVDPNQLLDQGDRAYRAKSYAEALRTYERFLSVADHRHLSYMVVQTRVNSLRKWLANK